MSARLIVIGAVAASTAVGVPFASAEVMSWQVGGEKRQAIVYAPAPAAGRKLPLVMSFHGRGDDMDNFQHVNLHVAWPDAVVVYFQGLPTNGGLAGWQVERGQYDDRDLKLVDTALTSLRTRFNIDETRVYATGFSNGAGFTYLLWAERPGIFAAYAPVAGRIRPSVAPKERRPVFHVGGTRDPQVLFEDQKAAFQMATQVNGVSRDASRCGSGCTLYGAQSASPVMVWVHEGGHEYPRGTSERIASFFHQHTLHR